MIIFAILTKFEICSKSKGSVDVLKRDFGDGSPFLLIIIKIIYLSFHSG